MTTVHFVDLHVLTTPDRRAAVGEALQNALTASADVEGIVRAPRLSRHPWPSSAGLVSAFFTQEGSVRLSPKNLAKAFEDAVLAVDTSAVVVSVGFCMDEAQVWCRAPSKDGFQTVTENKPAVLERVLGTDWESMVASNGIDSISTTFLPVFLDTKPLRKALERAGFDAPSPKVRARRWAEAIM